MNLPAPINEYFDADKVPGGDAPTQVFTATAVVSDEGKSHVGHDAIAAWWRGAKQKYRHTAVPIEIKQGDARAEVRAVVTGQFPGSPATLTFVFGLEDGRINSLRIAA